MMFHGKVLAVLCQMLGSQHGLGKGWEGFRVPLGLESTGYGDLWV